MWNLQFNGIQDGNCQGSIVDIQQSAWLQVELLVEHEDAEVKKWKRFPQFILGMA